jgi:hypothetical protein
MLVTKLLQNCYKIVTKLLQFRFENNKIFFKFSNTLLKGGQNLLDFYYKVASNFNFLIRRHHYESIK